MPLGDGPQFMPGNVGTPSSLGGSSAAVATTPELAAPEQGGGLGLPARGWADNPAPVNVGASPTTVAQVSVTPQVTGKLRVTITGRFNNPGPATTGINVLVAVNGAAVYTQSASLQQSVTTNAGWVALTVDLDRIAVPVVLPLNVAATVQAQMESSAGSVSVSTNGLELSVEEVF